jgi:hypothetical protein
MAALVSRRAHSFLCLRMGSLGLTKVQLQASRVRVAVDAGHRGGAEDLLFDGGSGEEVRREGQTRGIEARRRSSWSAAEGKNGRWVGPYGLLLMDRDSRWSSTRQRKRTKPTDPIAFSTTSRNLGKLLARNKRFFMDSRFFLRTKHLKTDRSDFLTYDWFSRRTKRFSCGWTPPVFSDR